MSALEIVERRLKDLKPYANSPRTPRQNWGKFKAHKWGGFTSRLDHRRADDEFAAPRLLIAGRERTLPQQIKLVLIEAAL